MQETCPLHPNEVFEKPYISGNYVFYSCKTGSHLLFEPIVVDPKFEKFLAMMRE